MTTEGTIALQRGVMGGPEVAGPSLPPPAVCSLGLVSRAGGRNSHGNIRATEKAGH